MTPGPTWEQILNERRAGTDDEGPGERTTEGGRMAAESATRSASEMEQL